MTDEERRAKIQALPWRDQYSIYTAMRGPDHEENHPGSRLKYVTASVIRAIAGYPAGIVTNAGDVQLVWDNSSSSQKDLTRDLWLQNVHFHIHVREALEVLVGVFSEEARSYQGWLVKTLGRKTL